MQSRPNNSQLQTRLVCRQGWRRSTLGSWQFISPTRFQNAQTGRRPGYARPPLPKESASRVENWATFSFDEPQVLTNSLSCHSQIPFPAKFSNHACLSFGGQSRVAEPANYQ